MGKQLQIDLEKMNKLIFDTDEILDAFGLTKNRDCDILTHWFSVKSPINAQEAQILESKRQLLYEEVESWNEEELKMNFLATLFEVVNLNEKGKFKLFYERPLSATIGGIKINVVCDAMLASAKGVATPKRPYFFLQEFKKQRGKEQDAEAQMLAAMLVAQHQNAHAFPIFGAYIQGKNWVFTTLHDQRYCASKQFDASERDDLEQIVHTLRHLKLMILEQLSF